MASVQLIRILREKKMLNAKPARRTAALQIVSARQRLQCSQLAHKNLHDGHA